jgi:hypothetical protein
MKLEIVQVSDIHLRATEISRESISSLVEAVRQNVQAPCNILLLVTGDIAYSGKESEYELATAFLNDLLGEFGRIAGVGAVDIAIVPGNHDCDFSTESAARKLLLKQINGVSEWDPSIPALASEVQTNFAKFRDSFLSAGIQYETRDLISVRRLILQEKLVSVWLLNSAWMSQLREAPGTLWFPIHALQDQIEKSPEGINILALHHPLAWFQPETRRALQQLINNSFHIVFAGHEHLPEVAARNSLDGNETLYIEGGVFQGHNPAENYSSLNLVSLDTNEGMALVRALERQAGQAYIAAPSKSWQFAKSPQSNKPFRILNEQWERTLHSAGATFRHPNKDGPLDLDEIFVEPDLVDMDDARETTQVEKILSAGRLLSDLHERPFVVIGGAEKSGKSALVRWLYLQLHSRGFTPVKLDGSSLRGISEVKIDKLVESEYLKQYQVKSRDAWAQVATAQRAILLDDLEAHELNSEARRELLETLKLKFPVVVITCEESLLLGRTGTDDDLAGYARLQLIEFGHLLRDALITKWLRVGRKTSLDQSAFQLLREQRVRAINTLIGTNFVPSRPIFLLTLLQSMEAGASAGAGVKGSSLGEYYEFLIRHALIGANVKPQDLDAVLNYLTELGYLLVSDDRTTLDGSALAAFDANFAQRYELRISFDGLHRQLINADILENWNDQFRFKYRYVLLFFGARYLALNFGQDPAIDKQVRALGQHLHVSKYADLMLFVVHHSNDPAVLDIILERAGQVFQGLVPLDLRDTDLEPISALVTEVPKLAMNEEAVEARRERRLRTRDASRARRAASDASRAQSLSLANLKERDLQEVLDYASELSLALRVLAILGQVLRNYYGSIRAERKHQLASESYSLVGRVLRSVVNAISNERDAIVTDVADALQKGGAQTPERAGNLAGRVVFGLTSLFIFMMIKRTSEFLGSDKLMPTHENVSAKLGTPLSRLIKLAITLDYPATNHVGVPVELPFSTIEDLDEEFKSSTCGSWVLRRIVLDYLYMFETSFRERQRICENLGITVKRQRQIGLLSHRKRDGVSVRPRAVEDKPLVVAGQVANQSGIGRTSSKGQKKKKRRHRKK